MNTNERILKLLQGGVPSRTLVKKHKLEYQDTLAGMDQNDPKVLKAQTFLESIYLHTSADQFRGKEGRKNEARAYEIANLILLGTDNPAAIVDPKVNGGEAHANHIYTEYDKYNQGRKNEYSALSNDKLSVKADTPDDNLRQGTYQFNWKKYIGAGYTGDMDTRGGLSKSYADGLLKSLNEAAYEVSKNNIVDGNWDPADKTSLENMLQTYSDDQWESDEAFKKLYAIARKYDTTGTHFSSYFGELMPVQSPAEINHSKLKRENKYIDYDIVAEHPYLSKFASQYKFMKDTDGNVYAYDKNYNPVSNLQYINLEDTGNPETNRYGYGIFSAGADGKVFLGNTADIDDSHWANQYFDTIKKELTKKYNHLFNRKTFNLENDFSEHDLVKHVVNKISTAHPDKKDIDYADVGAQFEGNLPVLAYNTDGSQIHLGVFGEVKYTPNTRFAYIDSEGRVLDDLTFEQILTKLNFKREGFDDEDVKQTGDIAGLAPMFEGVEGISNDTKLSTTPSKTMIASGIVSAIAGGFGGGAAAGTAVLPGVGTAAGAVIGIIGGAIVGAAAPWVTHLLASKTIGLKPKAFYDLAIKAIKDPDAKLDIPGSVYDVSGSEFINQFGSKTKVLETLGRLKNEGLLKLSSNELEEFNLYIRNEYYRMNRSAFLNDNEHINWHKEGGIIYAADGAILHEPTPEDPDKYVKFRTRTEAAKKEDADIEKAKAAGYDDVNKWRNDKNTELTATDVIRFGTIAADVASIVSSFTPGGAAVAEATGIGSFAFNTLADVIDPSISAGELLKNTAIGAGLAAISFIPGARIHKTLATVAKYAPKLMLAASTLGIVMDEDTLNTFKKVADGKEKLNVQDWRNIAHVTMLIAASTRGGRRAYEKRAVKNTDDFYKAAGPSKVTDIEGKTLGELKNTEEKQTFEKALKLAKEERIDDAVTELEKLKLRKEDKELTKDDLKKLLTDEGWFKKTWNFITEKSPLKATEAEKEWNYKALAKAYEDAGTENPNTLGILGKWSHFRNAPTWKQMGILDATGMSYEGTTGGTAGVAKALIDKNTTLTQLQSQGGQINYNKLRK